jgi:hypothetical protein
VLWCQPYPPPGADGGKGPAACRAVPFAPLLPRWRTPPKKQVQFGLEFCGTSKARGELQWQERNLALSRALALGFVGTEA